MKYLVLPIARVLLVLIALAASPIIYFFEGLRSFWHWDMKYIKDVTDSYINGFIVQSDMVKSGEIIWYYKTPIDYILRKKSYRIKT